MVKVPRNYAELKQTVPDIGIILASISAWYFFSLSISMYNKWMFGGNLNFKFPVIVTGCHQLVLFILSCLTLTLSPKFRLNYIDSSKTTTTTNQNVEKLSYMISPKIYISKIIPCAMASAGDIGLGNSSLKYISISLYTMLKTSAVLIFTLFWGVLLRLERLSLKLVGITLIMTVSVMMMVYGQDESNQQDLESIQQEVGELKFVKHLAKRAVEIVNESVVNGTTPEAKSIIASSMLVMGSLLVLLASCMSGLRWALTQLVLRGNKYTKNPILTIFYLAPAMSIILFIIGGYVEGYDNFTSSMIWEEYGTVKTCVLLFIPGVMAFCMTLAQFIILQYAPLLTMSIAGIFRELITIFLGWLVFGDQLNGVNLLGVFVTLCDLVWYNYYRLEQASKTTPKSSTISNSNSSSVPSSADSEAANGLLNDEDIALKELK